MTRQYTIQMAGGVARNPLVRLAKPVDLAIAADEHIAIVGPNGAGKSLLVDMLTGKYPLRDGSLAYDFSPSPTATVYDNIKYIAFRELSVTPMARPTPTIITSNGGMRTTKRRCLLSANYWARCPISWTGRPNGCCSTCFAWNRCSTRRLSCSPAGS